jgi:hypothetical protein
MSAATDARLYRRRLRAHRKHGLCMSGCGRDALVVAARLSRPGRIMAYCRRCGAARTLAQRRHLGQRPRSDSVTGRVSVYLAEGLR